MTDPLLVHFKGDKVQPHLKAVSDRFDALARALVEDLPESPGRTRALRVLIDARSAAITAAAVAFATTRPIDPDQPRETLDPFGRAQAAKENP